MSGGCQADADTADVALAMDEDAFRAFYDRTSGALWGYLSRISGDRQVADDLLQESYYRLLKSTVAVREREPPAQLPLSHRDEPGARRKRGAAAAVRRRRRDGGRCAAPQAHGGRRDRGSRRAPRPRHG